MNLGGYKVPKLTNSVAEQLIATSLRVYLNQLNFVKLADRPQVWKHACVPTGVAILAPRRVQYATGEVVEFAVCTACGKVIYYYENQF